MEEGGGRNMSTRRRSLVLRRERAGLVCPSACSRSEARRQCKRPVETSQRAKEEKRRRAPHRSCQQQEPRLSRKPRVPPPLFFLFLSRQDEKRLRPLLCSGRLDVNKACRQYMDWSLSGLGASCENDEKVPASRVSFC